MDASCFETERGCTYDISCIVSAYNDSSKDTRIYMEMDRANEQSIIDFLISCNAASVSLDSFAGDWELGSAMALANVTECGSRNGFTLMKSGELPKAGLYPHNTSTQTREDQGPINRTNGRRSTPPTAGGGDGGYSGAANDEEPLPRSGSDGEQHKRRRTVSPNGRDHNFEYCDYVLSKVEKEQQRRENVEYELKEMQMKHKLSEQRRALEEEWAVKRKDELTEIQRLRVSIDYFLYECVLNRKCLDRTRSRPRKKPTLMRCRLSLL